MLNKTEKTFQSKSAAINFVKIIKDLKDFWILEMFTKVIKLKMTIFEKIRQIWKIKHVKIL